MFEEITDVQITGVIRGNSTEKAEIKDRPSHTLIYKVNGESIYYLRNKSVHLSQGTVLYIPEGESYSFQKISEGESIYCLINFHCNSFNSPYPKLFSAAFSDHIEPLFYKMQKSWFHANNKSDYYELISLFYHLLSTLLQTENKQYYTATQKSVIAPAVRYLEEHLYDHALAVSELPGMCGISGVTFRNLFFAQFGESPKKYLIRQRLLKAKTIIESGEYSSIKEVAETVGYEDALYFSRHFKKYFGCSPSNL